MLKPRTRWKVAEPSQQEAERLAKEAGCSQLVAQLLINRNLNHPDQARRFLNIQEQSFYDPFLMKGMKETVERIQSAVSREEKILVFGDYDADGVSSTAVMVTALKEIGADVDYYIPNRFTEGYGPNAPALEKAKDAGISLVITVDTGISAVEEAEVARELGLDFIITDHHQPPPVLPKAFAIVNPHQKGCLYPFKGLSGAGVALKVAHALLEEVPEHLFDFAVLGTIADLVPLVEENRLLAVRGLEALRKSERPGILALLEVAGVEGRPLSAEDVGFALGPRLNAAGRLDSADPAVQLLLSEDKEEAAMHADVVDSLNIQRKKLVNEIADEAISEIENHFPPSDYHVLVVAKEGWNPGVIGIVASRIVERFSRPAIVLGTDPETGLAKGSARSIEGYDLYEELSQCRDLMQAFGGHPMAAGMTLETEKVAPLRERLNERARDILSEEDLKQVTAVDLCCRIEEITLERIAEIERLAPFGTDNPVPHILVEDVPITELRQLGTERNHLKAVLSNGEGQLECIGFRIGHLFEEISPKADVSVVGELQINEWNGFRKPQLVIRDIAICDWQLFDLRNERELSKRLGALPEEKRLFIAFRKETRESLKETGWMNPLVCVDEEERASVDLSGRYIVLLDLPYEEEQLRALFANKQTPERIYAVFHHEEEHFFQTIPSREHFKWFYAFLMKQGTLDLKIHGDRLAKAKGWSKETLSFMAKVFSELGFIQNENGKLSLCQSPEKKDLTESRSYRGKHNAVKLENDLCYASYSSLIERFHQFMKEPQTFEGVVS